MRSLKRNQQPFYYCLYLRSEDQYDSNSNLLPEPLIVYDDPVLMYANISAATGQAQAEQFGNLDDYDKVIVTTDMTCPIDEHTVLFIDKVPENLPVPDQDDEDSNDGTDLPDETEEEQTGDPESDDSETEDTESGDPETGNTEEPAQTNTGTTNDDPPYQPPKYDYIVKRIARSLNSISIAVRKVDVG